jgi:hypothetical protein
MPALAWPALTNSNTLHATECSVALRTPSVAAARRSRSARIAAPTYFGFVPGCAMSVTLPAARWARGGAPCRAATLVRNDRESGAGLSAGTGHRPTGRRRHVWADDDGAAVRTVDVGEDVHLVASTSSARCRKGLPPVFSGEALKTCQHRGPCKRATERTAQMRRRHRAQRVCAVPSAVLVVLREGRFPAGAGLFRVVFTRHPRMAAWRRRSR